MHLIEETTLDIRSIRDWPRARDGFPPYTADEMADLVAHIREYGPESIPSIVISPDTYLIDGYNRVEALRQAGAEQIDASIWAYSDDEEMFRHSIILNLKRRHLDTVTKARKAGQLAESYRVEAEERANRARSEAARGNDNAVKGRVAENSKAVTTDTLLPRPQKSTEKAAAELGVSDKTVRQVKKVDATGDTGLIKAMEQKHVSIAKAAKIAARPAEERQAMLAAVNTDAIALSSVAGALRSTGAEYFIAGCVNATLALDGGGSKTEWVGLNDDQMGKCLAALGHVLTTAQKWHDRAKEIHHG